MELVSSGTVSGFVKPGVFQCAANKDMPIVTRNDVKPLPVKYVIQKTGLQFE